MSTRNRQTKKKTKKKPVQAGSTQTLKSLVRDWLDEESIETKNVTQKNQHEFQFAIKYRNIGITIVQPKNKEALLITTGVRIDSPHLEILRKLSKKERFHIMNGLGRYIGERGFFQTYIFENQSELIFNLVVIETHYLYKEDITKTMFFEQIGSIRRGNRLVVDKFLELIGVEPNFSKEGQTLDSTYS